MLGLGLSLTTFRGGATRSYRNLDAVDIIGAWQHPRLMAHHTQYNTLKNIRLANVPLARATTYYVSPSGDDDANDGLSEETPFASATKAVEVIDNAPTDADICVLFERGYRYTVLFQWEISKNNLSFGAYGTAEHDPVISRVGWDIGSGTSWSNGSGVSAAGTYYITDANVDNFDYLQVASDTSSSFRPLQKCTTKATCMATDDSYWFDTANNRLHVRFGAGTNPGGTAFGAIAAYDGSNIFVTGDNVRFEHIEFVGFGMSPLTHVDGHTYSFMFSPSDPTFECVLESVIFRQCGYHAIGHIERAKLTCVNCKVGLCTPDNSGASAPTVHYTSVGWTVGKIESIFHNHVTFAGNLRFEGRSVSRNLCNAILAHSSGGQKIGQVYIRNHDHQSNPWSPGLSTSLRDIDTVGSPEMARCFLWNEVIDDYASDDPTRSTNVDPNPTGCVAMRCRYATTASGVGGGGGNYFGVNVGTGWNLKCIFDGHSPGGVCHMFKFLYDAGGFWNCHLKWRGAGNIFGTGDPLDWTNKDLTANILDCTYPNAANGPADVGVSKQAGNVNWNSNSDFCNGNAWHCYDPVPTGIGVHANAQGAIGDSNKVMLAYPRECGAVPSYNTDPLTNAVISNGIEWDWELDGDNNPILATVDTIGPISQPTSLTIYDPLTVLSGKFSVVLKPGEWYTDTGCTVPAVATNSIAGWKAAVGSNATQSTSGERPVLAASGGATFGTGKRMAITVGATDDFEVFAQVTKPAGEQLVVLGGPNAYLGVHPSGETAYWINSTGSQTYGYTTSIAVSNQLAWWWRDAPYWTLQLYNVGQATDPTINGPAGATAISVLGAQTSGGNESGTGVKIRQLWVTNVKLTTAERRGLLDYLAYTDGAFI